MYIHAGPEVGVASTKAFTGQVLSLFIIALALAKKSGALPEPEFQRFHWLPELEKHLPDMKEVLHPADALAMTQYQLPKTPAAA